MLQVGKPASYQIYEASDDKHFVRPRRRQTIYISLHIYIYILFFPFLFYEASDDKHFGRATRNPLQATHFPQPAGVWWMWHGSLAIDQKHGPIRQPKRGQNKQRPPHMYSPKAHFALAQKVMSKTHVIARERPTDSGAESSNTRAHTILSYDLAFKYPTPFQVFEC